MMFIRIISILIEKIYLFIVKIRDRRLWVIDLFLRPREAFGIFIEWNNFSSRPHHLLSF